MDILLDCLSGGGEREVETDSNAREKQVHAKEWVAVDRMMHARAVSRGWLNACARRHVKCASSSLGHACTRRRRC